MGMIICPGQKGLWEGSPILGRGDCGKGSLTELLICGQNPPIPSGEVWEGAPHSWQSSPRASGRGWSTSGLGLPLWA